MLYVTSVMNRQFLEQDGNVQNVQIMTSAPHVITETNIWSTNFTASLFQGAQGNESDLLVAESYICIYIYIYIFIFIFVFLFIFIYNITRVFAFPAGVVTTRLSVLIKIFVETFTFKRIMCG